MRRRCLPVGLALLVAPVALAACGDATRTPPRERLATAGSVMSGGSVAFTTRAEMGMGEEQAQMNMTITGEGALDLASRRGHMSMTIPGLASSLEMAYDSSAVYVRMPAMLTGGESRWVRGTGGAAGMRTGGRLGGIPSYVRDVLGSVEGEIRELGTDTVRGTDVTGYGFSVSGSQLWTGRGETPPALAETSVPVRAWIDGSDRVRRIEMEVDMSAATRAVREQMADTAATEQQRRMGAMLGPMTGTLLLTTDFYDFGTEVRVELPDSSEVVDADTFQHRMMERRTGG